MRLVGDIDSILVLSPNYLPECSKGVREEATLKSLIVLRFSSSFSIILEENRFDLRLWCPLEDDVTSSYELLFSYSQRVVS